MTEEVSPVRDSRGCFVKGHAPVNPRSGTTGKFQKLPRTEDTIVLRVPEPETTPEPVPVPAPVIEKPVEKPSPIVKGKGFLRRPDEW